MKMIFTNDEREQIYAVFSEISTNDKVMMFPHEAKALGEVMERTSGYRGKEKFDKEHLMAIGYVLTQIIDENPTPEEKHKNLIELYQTIVDKLSKKLDAKDED